MARARDYDDIPGTYVFDGRRSQQGYHLNMFCMSLNAEANRERFRADERAYLDGFDLTSQQRRAVLERDWLGLLQLGGNIYYTFKLAALDGLSMQDVGGAMSGVSGGEFNQMMIDGGRPVDGNRRTGEAPVGQSHAPQSPEAPSTAGHSS
ncbi:protocatechuate 4,5-dioxygenase subunit alpha [Candidatus Poriferisodalis sp.]|uniref:protocatechuate 4,5-dioxygenase subunit alpha n=1 Tax=Candidatus Poriferisodalis sp. TaxID=3101277 RepID=UPI003B025D89